MQYKKMKKTMDKKMLTKFGITDANTTFNYKQNMHKSNRRADIHGIFKYKDTPYMKWLKDQLERNETREKLIYYQNDLKLANERVNYRNQADRMSNEIQRDNLNHNTLEHLQKQINSFKDLKFGMS